MLAVRSMSLLLLVLSSFSLRAMSNFSNVDPYPVYTALFPYTFVTTNLRDYYIGAEQIRQQEWFTLSVSPYRQAAIIGRNVNGDKAELGDLKGHWNMMGLFYSYPTADPNIQNTVARDALADVLGLTLAENCAINTDPLSPAVINSNLFTTSNLDGNREFGFFSVPIKYRKYGLRAQLDFQFGCDFGLELQAGVADLIQTVTFNDLTCRALGRCCPTNCSDPTVCNIDQFSCDCKRVVMRKIMDQKHLIARTLGVNINNICVRSVEDTRAQLYWRHIFPVNQNRENFPYFLIMPYFTVGVSAPSGQKINPCLLFGLPTGNNGHLGVGVSAGLNIDFVETVEIGAQVGFTTFKARQYLGMPVPTNTLQSGMFPYKADLCLKPGNNLTFAAFMHARHFLYWLSLWAQWVLIDHCCDCFTNVKVLPFNANDTNPPPAAIDKMKNESKWQVHVINVGATYDISPNIALGLFWQAPVGRRNAYRSTTIMGSFIVTW